MVAMFEAREATALYVGEIDSAATPLTLVLLDGRRIAARPTGSVPAYGTVKLIASEPGLDGEPTWEDAEWQ